ncbi:hypothetical protein Fcan01_17060 [Folsomia candida]|uniref:Uncharacterized protein n=1 Tax=Folsomia candida TaxID=158441 RepID=A0A226DS34_FOLCA|nr:hypothetical protein Fcan01_17060 [Folsomia candida]
MRRTEQELSVGRIPLLQLLFVTYYPFGYKPCVEIIMDKRGDVSIRKTKRRFDKILAFVPIGCMSLSCLLCCVSLIIVTLESKTYSEMVMNPVLGTWGIGTLLSLTGTIVYKVWVFDGIDISVKMANEILRIEQEVNAGSSPERPRDCNYSPGSNC